LASSTFVDTRIEKRRVHPNSSTSKFDAVIELDSTSDTDRTPPPPLAIFLSQSKPAQKDVQPRRKRITPKDVIDLCSDDDTISIGRRDNRPKSSKVIPSKQNATIKSRKVIVLSSGDEVDVSYHISFNIQGLTTGRQIIRGCQCQQPNQETNLDRMDRKRGRHVGGKRDSPHRTPAHKFGHELPGPGSVVENDFVDEPAPSVDRPESGDHHPTLTQEFFNSLYKDSLQKPLADLPLVNKVFYPRLPYGLKSPPRVVRKRMQTVQSEAVKSESRSFFTRVISTLNKINDRTRKRFRAPPVCRGREQETCSVQTSVDGEPSHEEIDQALGSSDNSSYPELEVVANQLTPMSVTLDIIQACPVEDMGDTVTRQSGEVTGPMTPEVSGHIKNERSTFTSRHNNTYSHL